jgi:hypothetical protein
MHQNLSCLYVERWTTEEDLAAAAVWFRAQVPPDIEVELADTSGTYYFEVPAGAGTADVVELIRRDEQRSP